MGKIIVITSGKGGVGKTTLTVTLGQALADAGHSVLLVDGDMGLRDLDLVLGMENDVVFTSQDLWSGECFAADVILPVQKDIDFLPASQVYRWEDVGRKPFGRMLKQLKSMYDYIVIDSPAGIGRGFEAALRIADKAIVVTEPTWASLRDGGKVMDILREKRIFNYFLVINMMPPHPNDRLLAGEEITGTLQVEDVGTMLPYCKMIKQISHTGQLNTVGESKETDSNVRTYISMMAPLLDAVKGKPWTEEQIFKRFEQLSTEDVTTQPTSPHARGVEEGNALSLRRQNGSRWKWKSRRI